MNKKIISSVKGTRDFYPEEMRARRWLVEALRGAVEQFGYEEYDAPLLESLELFAAKSSTEIVERQSYVFEDRGGERLVVRPEMTPSLARLVAARQRELPSLLRWYTFAECWRYERPQKGRLRNFLQANVDLIGSDSVEADAEAIDVALSMLRSLGVNLEMIEVRLNDRRLLESWLREAGVQEMVWPAVLSLLDERDKLEASVFEEKLTELTSVTACALLNAKLSLDAETLASDPAMARLNGIKTVLSGLGWEKQIRIDPTIIRGFTYYTGMVFEVYDASGQFRRAIFGGGRYDGLVEAMGGTPVSGVGFAVSDVSLEQLLLTQGISVPETKKKLCMTIPYSEQEASAQQSLASMLRREGIATITSLPAYGFSRGLKFAEKRGVTTALLLGPDEVAQQCVLVRDLKDGQQTRVAIQDLKHFLYGAE